MSAGRVDQDTADVVAPAGHFRVYLGAVAGVGKTYDMLNEGRRRRERGTDVVVGFVESHKRPLTEALLEGLEVVPRIRSSTAAPCLRRWTSTPYWPATPRWLWWTSWPTPMSPAPVVTPSAGRTCSSSSTPVST